MGKKINFPIFHHETDALRREFMDEVYRVNGLGKYANMTDEERGTTTSDSHYKYYSYYNLSAPDGKPSKAKRTNETLEQQRKDWKPAFIPEYHEEEADVFVDADQVARREGTVGWTHDKPPRIPKALRKAWRA